MNKFVGEVKWKDEIKKLILIDESRIETKKLVRCCFRDKSNRRVSIFVDPQDIIRYDN